MPSTPALSPHCKKVLTTLRKSGQPMSAYDLLGRLQRFGIKAPPTVYRALETLLERGLVHRIESLGAFIACHDTHEAHSAQFAVCRKCKSVTEIHDASLRTSIKNLGKKLRFRIEREMLEVMGLCDTCSREAA